MKRELYCRPIKTKTDWGFIAEVALLLALIAIAIFFIYNIVVSRKAEENEFRASVQEELMLLRRDLDHNTKVMEVLGALIESNTAELDRIDTVRRVLEQEMLTYVEEGVAPPQIFVELYAKTLKVRQPGE